MQIKYWFRKSRTSAEIGAIQAVITIDGVSSTPISTGIQTERKNWNGDTYSFEGKGSAAKEKALHQFEIRMKMILQSLEAENPGEFIHPTKIAEVHLSDKLANKAPLKRFTMSDAIRLHLKLRRELMQAGHFTAETIENDEKYANNVIKFLRETGKLALAATSFNTVVETEFKHYMLTQGKASYYINRHLMFIKKCHKAALDNGHIKVLPLNESPLLKVKQKDPIVIEPWVVRKIEKTKFNSTLQPVADAWLFCQETSFAYIDYMSLKNDYLEQDDEGQHWIVIPRDKTENKHYTPMSKKAMAIVEKYGSLEQLPRRANSTMNKNLKEIAKFAEVDIALQFHMSRKAFAHNSLNYREMQDITVASAMGLRDTKTLKYYARVSKQRIKSEFFKKEQSE